ncbi:MAG: ATP-binding protein [Bacilli bacterium]|nr:ATP-binding protein [Bacilli bacterium]
MATLILLSAIPGSGKSTWAKAYQRAHPHTYIVASDDVRARVSGGIQCFDKEALVWETFLKELNAHVDEKDCTVIADATNLQNRYRRYYLEQTPGYDKHVLVLFDIPFDICMKQNKLRDKDRIVSDEGMLSLLAELETPTQEIIDLYDEYIVIDKSFHAEGIE